MGENKEDFGGQNDMDSRSVERETSQIEAGVEVEKVEKTTSNLAEEFEAFKQALQTELNEFESRIRSSIREAIKEVFAEFLEEDTEKTEELPKCPTNTNWLRKMFEILPEDILRRSKLWKYKHCIK